jgi:hypothetical protein
MPGLLAAAVVANLADLWTFLQASPAVVATEETSPLPHLMGQVAGGIAAKLVMAAAITITVVVFRGRPRTEAVLLGIYTAVGVAGAIVNSLVA